MKKKNNTALFFACSLIEQIGRDVLMKRGLVVTALGKEQIEHIYNYADVLHCEPLEKVADDIIAQCKLQKSNFDNVKNCQYTVPDVWTIGKVYARLIEDVSMGTGIIDTLWEVYTSWMDDGLSDYNAATYYQQREYLAESFLAGDLIDI